MLGASGLMIFSIAKTPATQALTKIAKRLRGRVALRPPERNRNAAPSGTAVSASPKLWIRSASRATLPVAT